MNYESIKIIVAESDILIRIDKFLSLKFSTSRSQIQKTIDDSLVFLNGDLVTSYDYKYKKGDKIEIKKFHEEKIEMKPEKIDIKIVYEDDDIIVLNKDAGMVVHPASGNYSGTLVNALIYHSKNNLSSVNGEFRPGIIHRLDKDTTGLIIIAKNDFSHNKLAEQFQLNDNEKLIQRIYFAFVVGVPPKKNGIIETKLIRSKKNREKIINVDTGYPFGKIAITEYKVEETKFVDEIKNNISLISFNLKTGRTHQIRAHCEKLKIPIIGDKVYGKVFRKNEKNQKPRSIYEIERQALHAKKIKFNHPRSNEKMNFEINLPSDMQKIYDEIFKIKEQI